MNLLSFPNPVWQDQQTMWLTLILEQSSHLQKRHFGTSLAQAGRALPFALTSLETTVGMTKGRCSIWWLPRTSTMHTLYTVPCACYCTFQCVVDILRLSIGWERHRARSGGLLTSQCKCLAMHDPIVPDCPFDGLHPCLKLVLAHCRV